MFVNVVDELEHFYPKEYHLLELLATDDYQAFKESVLRGDEAAHLFRYGVVSNLEYPFVTYSVLKEYVAIENARREGRRWRYRLIEPAERPSFIRVRIKDLVEDLRNLERLIKARSRPLLFGPNSFPEAEKLFELKAPTDAQSLGVALSTLQRCFVEAIEIYGESCGEKKYFWTVIKTEYPHLQEALHRIRLYRHNSQHLELMPRVEETLRRFLERDLDENLASSEEKYWALFQRCIDELFQAVQRETAQLESSDKDN
jgi:hypothetical protein